MTQFTDDQVGAAARAPHVFLDCDGVLADFDAHGLAYFGMPPREAEKRLGQKEFWRQLEARGDFYRSMPLMSDARELYEGVRHLNPTILTGCPRGNWAEAQKVAWAAEHFPGVPIITCRSADKRAHAKPGDILIDDWPEHRHRWIEMGGHFIMHADAATSLAALRAHLALSTLPPALGEGWVMVPRKPTEAMLVAANRASLSTVVLMGDTRFACEAATYRAAIAAAPSPPTVRKGE